MYIHIHTISNVFTIGLTDICDEDSEHEYTPSNDHQDSENKPTDIRIKLMYMEAGETERGCVCVVPFS